MWGRPPSMLEALKDGLTAPIAAVLSPRSFFEWLSQSVRKYGVYFTAGFYLGAWIGTAIIAWILVTILVMVRGVFGASLSTILKSPFLAGFYSIILPLIVAGLDAALIALVVYFDSERPPLHAVLAARASSLLPYTLRVVYLAAVDRLSPMALISIHGGLVSYLLIVLGVGLTAYGLYKMGVSAGFSLAGAALPLIYKLAVSF